MLCTLKDSFEIQQNTLPTDRGGAKSKLLIKQMTQPLFIWI